MTAISPGIPYCLATTDERVEFVLPRETDTRYVLVLGSLGNPHRRHRLEIHADPTDGQDRIDGATLPPWGANAESGNSTAETSPLRRDAGRFPFDTSFAMPRAPVTPRMSFHLHVTDGPLDDPRHSTRIETREIAHAGEVRVLLDEAEPRTSRLEQTAREIVRLFERAVLPRTKKLIGQHVDTDGDGRLAIVMTPWLGRLQGGRTSLAGLVRTADFRSDLTAPFSNQSDVLFLNSTVAPGPRLHALLAHEYAHVVTFSRRAVLRTAVEDDWLSEGIAHVSEHLHGAGWTNLDHRIARFLEAPQAHPLVIRDYYQSGLWRDPGCRGATFLFLRWCVDQFGESFPRRLIDGDAVGVRNIERSSGHPFDELFRRWCIAVYFAGTSERGGPLGYRSLSLNGRMGRHRLSGPKATVWRRDDRQATIFICGTAAAYVEIRSHSETTRRFRIRAPEGARLQATLIRIQKP